MKRGQNPAGMEVPGEDPLGAQRVSPHPGKRWERSRERKKDGSANALERKSRSTKSQAKAAQGGRLIPISSECGLQLERRLCHLFQGVQGGERHVNHHI